MFVRRLLKGSVSFAGDSHFRYGVLIIYLGIVVALSVDGFGFGYELGCFFVLYAHAYDSTKLLMRVKWFPVLFPPDFLLTKDDFSRRWQQTARNSQGSAEKCGLFNQLR